MYRLQYCMPFFAILFGGIIGLCFTMGITFHSYFFLPLIPVAFFYWDAGLRNPNYTSPATISKRDPVVDMTNLIQKHISNIDTY